MVKHLCARVLRRAIRPVHPSRAALRDVSPPVTRCPGTCARCHDPRYAMSGHLCAMSDGLCNFPNQANTKRTPRRAAPQERRSVPRVRIGAQEELDVLHTRDEAVEAAVLPTRPSSPGDAARPAAAMPATPWSSSNSRSGTWPENGTPPARGSNWTSGAALSCASNCPPRAHDPHP